MTGAGVRRLPSVAPTWEHRADVVVVGAGAAGASAALAAARGGRRVALLCKGELGGGATAWAQGGLAAVVASDDSLALHVGDTVAAGAGLCDRPTVDAFVSAAPDEVSRLGALGAVFDTAPDDGFRAGVRGAALAVTREGGHSRDRVVHAGGDASGAEVARTLAAALRRSAVEVFEHVVALDALLDEAGGALGVLAAQVGGDGRLRPGIVHAAAVVLATGGVGQAWATTTNPVGATGDGLALALRAGAEIQDVEFVQFHPTVLDGGPGAAGQQLLITEALRGEGAVLVDETGRRLMAHRHPDGDLAPRDVVAAAIHEHRQQLSGGIAAQVFLDATALGRAVLERRFPTVVSGCRARGTDPVTDPIPVSPGAHYSCGGVRADLWGRTSVPGLLAVGEVASTGVHGANRLASNSIPEGLVAGRRAGELLAAVLPSGGPAVARRAGEAVAAGTRIGTAERTSAYAGVVRCGDGLRRLLDHLASRPGVLRGDPVLSLDVVEATALHTVSTAVATAALHRQESRGCHRRSDFVSTRPNWQRHVAWRLDGDGLALAAPAHEAAA